MPDNSNRHPAPRHAPIAIIGVGCRYPGAHGTAAMWQMLTAGRDMTSDVPENRFALERFYAPELRTPGKTASRRGAFVDDVDLFDASFFDVSAHEASRMDPQQRLLLMTAYEALEDAGLTPAQIAGTRTAVYVGMNNADYWDRQHDDGVENFDLYSFTGMHQRSVYSGRLSFTFDLRGPSVTLDTACASSLTAVHQACMSLRSGDSTLAMVGGVSLMLGPNSNIMLAQAGMMAPDGKCKFGDESADGFVRGEGVGVLLLKPLDQALADNDNIRAVILGSAVSNDGRSKNVLTAPSATGQKLAIGWAYENAGITPSDVDYVEAHGTGTRIDQIELAALGDVLGKGRAAERPLIVGSIKTNIGHSEGATGLAGIIKTTLCLQHRQVPPNLHFNTPHSKIDWKSLPLMLPTAMTPLPDRGRPTVAGVSGQGISSTNAHVVLAQAEAPAPRPEAMVGRPHTLYISGKSAAARDALARAYVAYLSPGGAGNALELRDVSYTNIVRRHHHSHRMAVMGASHGELVAELKRHLENAPGPARESRAGDGLWLQLEAEAQRYLAGEEGPFGAHCEPNGRVVSLPHYAWQLQSYWLAPLDRSSTTPFVSPHEEKPVGAAPVPSAPSLVTIHPPVPGHIDDAHIASLDPLGVDERMAALPRLNAQGDQDGVIAFLRDSLPSPAALAAFDPSQCLAVMRDLGMLIGSIRRYGTEPVEAIPQLEPVLLQLGERTQMIPRDTISHYVPWNPQGPRERNYTDDPMERHLMTSVRMSLPALITAVSHCQSMRKSDPASEAFAHSAGQLAVCVAKLEEAIDLTLRLVSPEFFARRMRYYFEAVKVGGKVYCGPAAAHVPLTLVDLALWASDMGTPEYEEFWRESVQYNIPARRALFSEFEHGASLTTRFMESYSAGEPTAILHAGGAALAKAMHSLVVFRGRHYTIARKAYDRNIAFFDLGSGGGSIDMLKEVLDRTRELSKLRRHMVRREEVAA